MTTHSGQSLQTKTKRELNVKRILCIGGSLAAVVILIILMAGTSSRSTAPAAQTIEDVTGETPSGVTLYSASLLMPTWIDLVLYHVSTDSELVWHLLAGSCCTACFLHTYHCCFNGNSAQQ